MIWYLRLWQFVQGLFGYPEYDLGVTFGDDDMGSVTLKTNQTVVARVAETVDGVAVTPTGPFTWDSANSAVATVVPSADTLSAVVTPVGPGSVSIHVSKSGASGSGTVTVVQAVIALEVVFDTPTP